MKRGEIMAFFEHVVARQASHQVADAFRFKAVLSGRNNGTLQQTAYPNSTIWEPDSSLASNTPMPREIEPASEPNVTPALGSSMPHAYQMATPVQTPVARTKIKNGEKLAVEKGQRELTVKEKCRG